MNRLWLTWFLAIVFFIVVGVSLSHAETMFTQNGNGDRVTIFEKPCTNGKILAAVEKAFLEAGSEAPTDLQSGEVRFVKEGKFPICWRVNMMLQVGIVYESGDAVTIPLLAFETEKSI